MINSEFRIQNSDVNLWKPQSSISFLCLQKTFSPPRQPERNSGQRCAIGQQGVPEWSRPSSTLSLRSGFGCLGRMLCEVGKCGGTPASTSTTFRITSLIVNNLQAGTPLSVTPLVRFFIFSLLTTIICPTSSP